MEYIVIDNDKIKKYIVSFNNEDIINLKNKVVDECSEIKHEIFEDNYYPFAIKSEDFEYRNIKSLSITNYHNDNDYRFKYEFDKYIYPYLVKIINSLLNGDNTSIEDIFKYKGLYDFYVNDVDDKIDILSDELMDEEKDIDEKLNITDQIKDLLLRKKAMLLNGKTKLYYDELQQLLSFKLVDEIDLVNYEKVKDMLNIDYVFNEDVYKYKK